MSTAQEAIQRLQIETTSDGTDAATAALDKLAEAYGGVTVASTSTEKSTTSLDTKFASIEQRYNAQVKALNDFQKVQKTVNAAVSQNPALQDRANAVLAAARQRYDDLTGTQSVFEKGLDVAGEKAGELTRELGPLGSALALIGPAGLAIGAAIGVAVLAFDKLKEQANEAGQWASQLQNAANVIGLNTTQLQALNEAAGNVGVSANDNISAFERFSASLGQLRDGSGQLYTQLLKVNPALVNQLSVTKDAATGWNLLAQAYAQADKQQQALIARAAFGRSGAAEGAVLLATANAGGVPGLQAANEDAISQDQIKRWADLTTQIKSATEAAQHNFQSIFTTTILEKEKAFAENLLNISRYAKDFTLSEDLKFYLGKLASGALSIAGGLPIIGPAIQTAQAAGKLATPGFIPRPASTFKGAGRDFDSTFGAVDAANSATSQGQLIASLGVQASQAKTMVAALGSAATAQQKLDATTKQLALDLQNGTIDQTTYNRAIAGANLDAVIAQHSLYVSALGELATTQDVVKSKTLSLQKAQQQGAGLTGQQIAAVKNLTAANDEWSRVNGQAQIGVFNVAAATKAAGDQFQSWIDKKYLDPSNPEQYAAALQAMANKLQATADAAKVAGSAFPQLTQLNLDAGNIGKQLDATSVTSLNAISSSLVDMTTGAKSAGDAFKDMAANIIRAIEQMIIQMTIIKPLASGLQSVLGGFAGGGSGAGVFGFNPIAGATGHAAGGYISGPGSGTSDSIAARLSNGEFVVNAPATARNLPLLNAINDNHPAPSRAAFAGGGLVAGQAFGAPVFNLTIIGAPSQPTVTQKPNGTGGGDIQVAFANAVADVVTADAAKNGRMSKAFAARAAGYKGS